MLIISYIRKIKMNLDKSETFMLSIQMSIDFKTIEMLKLQHFSEYSFSIW
jgi:hypothetical protein